MIITGIFQHCIVWEIDEIKLECVHLIFHQIGSITGNYSASESILYIIFGSNLLLILFYSYKSRNFKNKK